MVKNEPAEARVSASGGFGAFVVTLSQLVTREFIELYYCFLALIKKSDDVTPMSMKIPVRIGTRT